MADPGGIIRDTAVIAVALVAAVWDLRTRRIPSWLTVPGILAGLIYGAIVSTLSQFAWLVATTALIFVIGFLLYVASILGGGDGKLLTCVAALTGPGMFAERMAWLLISAVVVSIAILAWTRALLPFGRRVGRSAVQLARFGLPSNPMEGAEPHRMPFAVVVLLGVSASVLARHLGVRLLG